METIASAAAAALPATERVTAAAAAADALLLVADAAQGRVSKLVGARDAVHARLELGAFVSTSRAVDRFLALAEGLSGRRCLSLRASATAQRRAFLAAAHARFVASLGAALDAETWAPKRAARRYQAVLNALADAGRDPDPRVEIPTPVVVEDEEEEEEEEEEEGQEEAGSGSGTSSSSTTDPTTLLLPGGGPGISAPARCAPGAASLLALSLLGEYVNIVRAMPSLRQDALHRACELVKVFNARACALVLGAESVRRVRLFSSHLTGPRTTPFAM